MILHQTNQTNSIIFIKQYIYFDYIDYIVILVYSSNI